MPNDPSPAQSNMRHFFVHRWYLIILFAVLSIVFGYYVIHMDIPKYFVPDDETQQVMPAARKESAAEVLAGKIYMSLAPIASREHYSQTLFSYDTQTNAFTQVLAAAKRDYLTSKISPDGTRIVFASISSTHDEVQLLLGDRLMTDLREIGMDIPLGVKRSPSWSPDSTKIVFSGKTDENGRVADVEKWGVYVYDISLSTTALVSTGTNPIFLPDGALAVLKKDGIHRIDIADMSDSLVLGVATGTASSNMTFDVSRDGKHIVWATPESNSVRVMDVPSWKPFRASTTADIAANVFWPVFSPGGEYISMEEFDWEVDGQKSKVTRPRLTMYSLRDGSRIALLNLEKFYQDKIFITDWR